MEDLDGSIRHEVACEIGKVIFSYYLKEHDTDKGRYQLITRVGRMPIITCFRTNDHNWKDRYFFVKRELVYGPRGPRDAPVHWKATSKSLFCLSSLYLIDTNLFACADRDFNQVVPSGLVAEAGLHSS